MILLYHSLSCVCMPCLTRDTFFDPMFNVAIPNIEIIIGKVER